VAQLEAAGVPVRGGLGLWLEGARLDRVACVTGTKGKSTTTALAVHLLNRLGYDARVGGNIGQPPWDPLVDDADYWVIETSSFQVPDVTTAPHVVAVTSLFPDHLDWHGDVDHYYADKLSLCTKPGIRVALADASDARLRQHAVALGPHLSWVETDDLGPWAESLRLPGAHNRRNAAVARAVLAALGIPEAGNDDALAAAVTDFDGLPSRCRTLGFFGGIEFVDDSLSTNVLPTEAALASYAERPVALLVGGHDRGIEYGSLGDAISTRRHPTLVVTMPDNGQRIGAAIRASAGTHVDVVDADGLTEAVAVAFGWTPPGGVVLLSPAAPSFGRFADYRERAQAFADAAAQCGAHN
jgi:UDP-N-acetylmuramoylalanine--D-glutamate ligase